MEAVISQDDSLALPILIQNARQWSKHCWNTEWIFTLSAYIVSKFENWPKIHVACHTFHFFSSTNSTPLTLCAFNSLNFQGNGVRSVQPRVCNYYKTECREQTSNWTIPKEQHPCKTWFAFTLTIDTRQKHCHQRRQLACVVDFCLCMFVYGNA